MSLIKRLNIHLLFFFITGISFFLFLDSCKPSKIQEKESPSINKLWKELDSLENLGLGRQVLEKSNQILVKSKEQELIADVFKALAYRSKYFYLIEEEGTYSIIKEFESTIAESRGTQKRLLHSAVGELYAQLYQEKKWSSSDQKNVLNPEEGEWKTLSASGLKNLANYHYKSSLFEPEKLAARPITSIQNIILFNEKVPIEEDYSLLEFLSQRAIQFLQNDAGERNYLIENQNEAKKYFHDLNSFLQIDSTENPEANFAISLFQNCLTHASEERKIVLDLHRLSFFKRELRNWDVESYYEESLLKLLNTRPNNAEIIYSLASYYSNKAQVNKSNGQVKALELISKIETIDESVGAKKARNLQGDIEQKLIGLKTESVYYPNEKLLFNLEHKNLSKVYFKLFRLAFWHFPNNRNLHEFNPNENIVIKQWVQSIDYNIDYLNHYSDLSIPELNPGSYILLACDREQWDKDNSVYALSSFQVSSLSLKQVQFSGQESTFQVLDRNTGKTVPSCRFTFVENNHRTGEKVQSVGKSNESGIFNYACANRRAFLFIHLDKDTFNVGSIYCQNYLPQPRNNRKAKNLLFTDRSLYQAGQTLKFKAIALKAENLGYKVNPDTTIQVILQSSNQDIIFDKTFDLDEYGTCAGQIQIPEEGLNGDYYLRANGTSSTIKVEAYERPAFYCEIDSLSKHAKLNETSTIYGKVTAYAGFPIQEAKISYSIAESKGAIIPFYSSYYPFGGEEKTIQTGAIKTDNEGNFSIPFFVASKINKDGNRTKSLKLKMDILGLGGKSIQKTHSFQLSESGLYFSTNIPEVLKNNQNWDSLKLICKNQSKQAINNSVLLKLFQKEQHTSYQISSLWPEEDLAIWNQEERNKYFPHRKTKIEESEKLLLQNNYTLNQGLDFIGKLNPGSYRIEILNDKQESLNDFSFRVIDSRQKQLAEPKHFFIENLSTNLNQGDTAKFLVGSSATSLLVEMMVELNGKLLEQRTFQLSNGQKIIAFPLKKEYLGSLHIYFNALHLNRNFQESYSYFIPSDREKLNIEFIDPPTIVEPGDSIEAKIKVTGVNSSNKKINLSLAMHDAALDAIYPSNWNLQEDHLASRSIRIQIYGPNISYSHRGQKRNSRENIKSQYYRLNWFGFYLQRYFPRMAFTEGIALNAASADISIDESLKQTATSTAPTSSKKEIRNQFSESALFVSNLISDDNGFAKVIFTVPDDLTKWRLRVYAFDKDYRRGYTEHEMISKKDFMLLSQIPTYLVEGDQVYIRSTLINRSDETIAMDCSVHFYDAISQKELYLISGREKQQSKFIGAKESVECKWKIQIPEGLNGLKVKILAKGAQYFDGIEQSIPILKNKLAISESFALQVPGSQDRKYEITSIKDAAFAKTKGNLKLEITSNPISYVYKALAYIPDKECLSTEEKLNDFASRAFAKKVKDENPTLINAAIQNFSYEDYQWWQKQQNELILSPWLSIARTDKENSSKINAFYTKGIEDSLIAKKWLELFEHQKEDGGFSWLKEGESNYYSSLKVLELIGALNAIDNFIFQPILIEKLQKYIDATAVKQFFEPHFIKSSSYRLKALISYHYPKSYFDNSVDKRLNSIFYEDAEKYWTSLHISEKAKLALILFRLEEKEELQKKLMASIIDLAQSNADYLNWNYPFNELVAPFQRVEDLSQLLLCFTELQQSQDQIDKIAGSLIAEKRGQIWLNKSLSFNAAYALYKANQGRAFQNGKWSIQIGNKTFTSNDDTALSYAEFDLKPAEWDASFSNLFIKNENNQALWLSGFVESEQAINQIKESESADLILHKTYYKLEKAENKEVWIPLDSSKLQLGDRILVRLQIKSSRDLSLVEIRDFRPACFQASKALSGYQFADKLYYYQSHKKSSSNFYIEFLPKGITQIEYEGIAISSGFFNAGSAAGKSLYNPVFSGHSSGRNLEIIP